MWLALERLTAHANETAIANPAEHIGVSGLIEAVLFAAIKVQTLEAIADGSPEFHRAIAAWVASQIEGEPATAAVFSSSLWSFTKPAN
jgi:hypothetical protein